MIGQLDRSRARRRLTSLCSNLILEILDKDTDQNTLKAELENKYKSACIIALGVSVEALTGKEIQKSTTTNGRILSFSKLIYLQFKIFEKNKIPVMLQEN